MAIAGRVAIVPKGDWSAYATYKRLDAVTYNNTLYFAKKNVPVGTATSNTEYWSKSIVGNPDKSSDQQGQNLITYPYYSKSSTANGITWTVNDDGTVTANGTATKESAFDVVSPFDVRDRKTLELNQKYVLSDGTSDKAKAYTQFVRFNASTNTYNYGISSRAGYNTWTASDKNLLSYGIRLIVANGATVNNVAFKPMLEIGTVSHEYQPTTLSNPTLKEQIGSALQPESIVNNQTTTKAGFALDARQANPNIDGSLAKQISDLNGSLNSKKIPSFGIENIFTGNPFAVIADSGDLATVGGTKWEQDNGGYHVEDIKYPAGGSVFLTVSMTLPANSIVLIDVNTLNYENIKLQDTYIKYNLTSSPNNDSFSIFFSGRNANVTVSTIRYMPLVIHLG